MRFDEHFLDEIKSRLRPSDVIGRTVKLRKQGREYVGLSPFTKEKTPSFYVNDDKGQFFDFSSGKTGDLISFLQETERLSFVEAVERLAAEAGVPLPAVDPRAAEQEKTRQSLLDWLETACQWFESELKRPAGREARAYLEKRGLPEKDWARFRLGFSPAGRTALKDYLVAKGARPAELVEAGLLIAPEEGGAPYDRFRDRIIFPILDARGRVVSFGGRAMDPQARAKYLNGPETPAFHKGHQLYGLSEARKVLAAAPPKANESGEEPPLVVVEGYMDVIACLRSGIPAVAPMGTALGEEQMEALWRHHPEPTLSFDGDRAGRQAAARVMDRALPLLTPGRSFKFAIVEGGKDPDEVLREQGPAALKAQLSRTTPFVEALFLREKQLTPLETPEQRAGFKVRLRQVARQVRDADLAEQYRIDLLRRFEESFPRNQFVPAWANRKPSTVVSLIINKNLAQILRERTRRLNASVAVRGVQTPALLLPYVEEIAAFGFGDPPLRKVADAIVEALSEPGADQNLLMSFIRHARAEDAFNKAFRIAHEVPTLPFLDPAIPEKEAERMWRRALEGIIELAALRQAVAERPPIDDPNDFIERRRTIRSRRHILEHQLSDLTIWAE
ncbi:DNA primase [Phenylobacterium sp.]|uniref:DNA primase n=1 Tax=Phenylobacterium sp. TaxID=1871053 RepID=UPI00261896C4|nr:DNA primase [Phenylobacterium sp.]